MINGFVQPDSFIHDKVYQYEKSLRFTKNLFISLLVLSIFVPVFIIVSVLDHNKRNNNNQDYLTGFQETEENIILQLYGDRNAYAESKAFQKRSEFLDKDATRLTGEMTYDEEAYQAYYDSCLAEFDSKIDKEKVKGILEEHQEAYIAERKAVAEATPITLLSPTYLILTAIGIALLAGSVWYNGRRLRFIKNKDYLVTTSVVHNKFLKSYTRRLRTYVTVDIPGNGQDDVLLSGRQVVSVHEGDEVYVVFHTGLSKHSNKYSICGM